MIPSRHIVRALLNIKFWLALGLFNSSYKQNSMQRKRLSTIVFPKAGRGDSLLVEQLMGEQRVVASVLVLRYS